MNSFKAVFFGRTGEFNFDFPSIIRKKMYISTLLLLHEAAVVYATPTYDLKIICSISWHKWNTLRSWSPMGSKQVQRLSIFTEGTSLQLHHFHKKSQGSRFALYLSQPLLQTTHLLPKVEAILRTQAWRCFRCCLSRVAGKPKGGNWYGYHYFGCI